MTKTFQVERSGYIRWVIVRQMAHDPQYTIGSIIPKLGRVIAIQGE